MTEPVKGPLTVEDVGKRFSDEGFEAATATLRKWLARQTVSGPDVVTELRYWLDFMGGK